MSNNIERFNEVLGAIWNISGMSKSNHGYKALANQSDMSNRITEVIMTTVESLVNEQAKALSIDDKIGITPDLIVKTVYKTDVFDNSNLYNDISPILGFEHFAIGCRYKKKGNMTYRFLNTNYKNKLNQLVKLDAETGFKGNIERSIIDSFKDSYIKHFNKINTYISNMKNIAKSNNIDANITSKSVWFIIDNLDSLAIDLDIRSEMPLIFTKEVLDILSINDNHISKLGGIIYIGPTSVFILPSETIQAEIINTTHNNYTIQKIEDVRISCENMYNKDVLVMSYLIPRRQGLNKLQVHWKIFGVKTNKL